MESVPFFYATDNVLLIIPFKLISYYTECYKLAKTKHPTFVDCILEN